VSFVRGTILVSLAEYAAILAGLAQAMVFSRGLGPDGIGRVSLLRQTALFAVQLSSLGLPMAAVYAINNLKKDPSRVLVTTMAASGAASAGAIAVLALLLVTGTGYFGSVTWVGLAACLALVPTTIIRQVLNQYNLANLRARALSVIRAAPDVTVAVVGVCLFLARALNVTRVLVLIATIPTLGMILSYLCVRGRMTWRVRPDWSYLRTAIPLGMQIFANDLLYLLNGYVAFFMMRWYGLGFEDLGYFSRGLRVATIMFVASRGFFRLLYAKWSSLEGPARREHAQRSLNVMFLASVLCCGAVFVLARYIVLLLFGARFLPAVPVTRILVAGVVGYVLSSMLNNLYIADGKPYYNLMVLSAGLVGNLALCVGLIPFWGRAGAATAMLGCYIIMGLVTMYIGCARYGLRPARVLIPSPDAFGAVIRSLRTRPRRPAAGPEASGKSAGEE